MGLFIGWGGGGTSDIKGVHKLHEILRTRFVLNSYIGEYLPIALKLIPGGVGVGVGVSSLGDCK